jgi:hypothetical protein
MMAMVGAGAFVFAFMLFGPLLFGFLTVIAVAAAIGYCHYLVWGRSQSEHNVLLDEGEMEPPGEENGWSDGPHPHRRF